MDAEDGGYTYASNVDNHRSLMADLCDIKAHAAASEWTAAKGIYTNGKNAERAMAHTEASHLHPVKITDMMHSTATALLTL